MSDLVLTEAAAALQAGHIGEAKRLAQQSLAQQPDNAQAWVILGRAARLLGDGEGAIAAVRQAAQLAPARAEPAFLLCAMLLKRASPEAQSLLGQILTRFPNEAAGWAEVGQVLMETGKHEAALICFTRAAHAKPGFQVKLQCGLILKQLGRFSEAAEAFKDALLFDATSARTWFLLGICYQNLRDSKAAENAYRETLNLDPRLAEASVNLGTVLQDKGDLAAAKTAYGQALRARADTFGRITQAMTAAPKGELWLDLGKLRVSLTG